MPEVQPMGYHVPQTPLFCVTMAQYVDFPTFFRSRYD